MRPVLFLAIATVALACSGGKKDGRQERTATAETVKKVHVVIPVKERITLTEEFTANVEPFVRNNIAPQMPNRISHILVEVGQNVQRGQTVAILDNSTLQQQEIRLNNMRKDLSRVDELYKVGGISKSQWEAQKSAYDVAAAALKNVRENTHLVSPISGVISMRNYDDGDMYNGQVPIVVVEQVNPVKIQINVSERFYSVVKRGKPVSISLDVFPGETFEGTIALVAPTIDPRTRTFLAEVYLKNSNSRVRPGMFAHVALNMGQEDALLIPDVAVQTLTGTNDKFVFVVENGIVVHKVVTIGSLQGNRYVVKSGIDVNDQVVVSGFSALKNGDKVEILSNK